MPGSKIGGERAAVTNKAKYDELYLKQYNMTFYQYLGKLGGKKKTTKPKGFAAMPKEKVSAAGKIGGHISRRGKKVEV